VTLQRAGLNLREFTLALTNDLTDRLYTATPGGLVLSLREIGQLQPRPLRDPKLPPFGYIPPEGAMPTPAAAPPAETPAPAAEGAAAPANP